MKKTVCGKNLWERILSFALAFALGLLAANLLHREKPAIKKQENVKPFAEIIYREQGSGRSGACRGRDDETKSETTFRNQLPKKDNAEKKPVKIVSKPRADYTEAARENQFYGIVRLKVTFLANGQIGNISPINNLPYGLTEQAMAAARQIKFEPATRDGVPFTVAKVVEYSFTIY